MTTPETIDPDTPVLPALRGPIGPALPISAARADALVEGALVEMGGRSEIRHRALLIAAAFLLGFLLSGGGAYAVWQYLPALLEDPVPSDPTGSPSPTVPPLPEAEPDDEEPEEPEATSAGVDDTDPQPRPGRARPRGPDRSTPSAEASDAQTSDDEGAPTAGELLAEANALRAQRRWADAERTYTALVRSHPGSSDAYAALVAAASLRLEKLRNPRGAMSLYRQALRGRPRGHLAEEARLGIAESHRALGNRSAEAQALRELLSRHPRTPHRARAEARLRELDPTSESP